MTLKDGRQKTVVIDKLNTKQFYHLDKSAISAFDQVVETGSIEAIKLAVSGLKAEYDAANGVEGRMVTGKAPTKSGDVFRSQVCMVVRQRDHVPVGCR